MKNKFQEKIVFKRNEAITLASFYKFLYLTQDEYSNLVEDVLCELDLKDIKESGKSEMVRKFLFHQFFVYTNKYIITFLYKHINAKIDIDGRQPKLYACSCCGYKTIPKKSQYCICKVCYWEDDNLNKQDDYFSSVNKMTLHEAKNNFVKFGAISQNYLDFIDKDRMIQFSQ